MEKRQYDAQSPKFKRDFFPSNKRNKYPEWERERENLSFHSVYDCQAQAMNSKRMKMKLHIHEFKAQANNTHWSSKIHRSHIEFQPLENG